jgi:hypothetical protein
MAFQAETYPSIFPFPGTIFVKMAQIQASRRTSVHPTGSKPLPENACISIIDIFAGI